MSGAKAVAAGAVRYNTTPRSPVLVLRSIGRPLGRARVIAVPRAPWRAASPPATDRRARFARRSGDPWCAGFPESAAAPRPPGRSSPAWDGPAAPAVRRRGPRRGNPPRRTTFHPPEPGSEDSPAGPTTRAGGARPPLPAAPPRRPAPPDVEPAARRLLPTR